MSGVSLKVATWNIHKCVGTDRRCDPERVARVLCQLDADIIALQEADKRFGARLAALPLALIESATPYQPVPLHIRPGGLGWHGNALLVRKGSRVRAARPLDLPTLEPRGAVMAEVEVAGHMIRIVGVHLDLSGLVRRRQIRAILRHCDGEARHLPTVLMGDFNQWSDRGALGEFAFHHHRLIYTPPSFHSRRPVARLDRIIVSHDIGVTVTGVGDGEAAVASDHLPVWAQLHLR